MPGAADRRLDNCLVWWNEAMGDEEKNIDGA
jgi:hypothetical protein